MAVKKYTIQELADILGVSVAAIRKKITTDEYDTNIKRYKKRYKIVMEEIDGRNVMLVCLSDSELEEEIRLADVNKTKHAAKNNVLETYSDTVSDTYTERHEQDTVNVSDDKLTSTAKEMANVLINFTERYNNDMQNLMERVITAESKQVLLEDKANREGLYLQDIKAAKQETRNVIKYFTITLIILSILLILSVIVLIHKYAHPTVIEKQIVVEKQVPAKALAQPTKKQVRRR